MKNLASSAGFHLRFNDVLQIVAYFFGRHPLQWVRVVYFRVVWLYRLLSCLALHCGESTAADVGCQLLQNIKDVSRVCYFLCRLLPVVSVNVSVSVYQSKINTKRIEARQKLHRFCSFVDCALTDCDRAFPVAAPRAWNSLPPSLRTVSSLVPFGHQLKTFLFVHSSDLHSLISPLL